MGRGLVRTQGQLLKGKSVGVTVGGGNVLQVVHG